MKILNKIIESKEFGGYLFGDLFGNDEPDTKIEKKVLNSLNLFFSDFQQDISSTDKKQIVKDIKMLYKHKEDFPNLLKCEKQIYRYTKFNPKYDYYFDFEKTLKSIKIEKNIYLASINNYGTNTNISSWTTKPFDKRVMVEFNDLDSLLLTSNNNENTIMTDETSENIKKLKSGHDNEFEVIKITNKKPERVDIIYSTGIKIDVDFIVGFLYILNEKYDTRYNINDYDLWDINKKTLNLKELENILTDVLG